MLQFRPLTPADFPLLLEWLGRPHVKQWWDDGDDTLEKVAAHYGEDEPGLARFILLETGGDPTAAQPLGYFQYYTLSEGVIGIDQFIGEADRVNQGLGTQAVRQFVTDVVAPLHPHCVILDHDPANARAIRCYEKAGFRHYETVPTEEGDLAYMMKIDMLTSDHQRPALVPGRDYIGVGVGAMVFNGAGQVFLAQRGPAATNERGAWEFPGGKVAFGETLAAAICREFEEEYGMTIALTELLGVPDHILPDERQHWISPTFLARHVAGEPGIREPAKCAAIGWFALDALPAPLSLVTQADLELYQAKHSASREALDPVSGVQT